MTIVGRSNQNEYLPQEQSKQEQSKYRDIEQDAATKGQLFVG